MLGSSNTGSNSDVDWNVYVEGHDNRMLARDVLLPGKSTDTYLTNRVDCLPDLILSVGDGARFSYEEFVFGRIRNLHTRKAYQHAIYRFLGWSRGRGLELRGIAPKDVGQYLDGLEYAPATKKLHLATLRHFFDELVTRHVVVLNPASSVRGERYQVIEGKTPKIGVEGARLLLRSIDTRHAVGLRDRAIIGLLIYTAARVGAVAKLARRDFTTLAINIYCGFSKRAESLQRFRFGTTCRSTCLSIYVPQGATPPKSAPPLFLSATGRSIKLTVNLMTAGDLGGWQNGDCEMPKFQGDFLLIRFG